MVVVETPEGEAVGSAFHLGDGYYATACHVVCADNVTVKGLWPEGVDEQFAVRETYPDERHDVAVIRIDHVPRASIPLGGHLNDWIRDEDFVLWEVLVMGYPPIPKSQRHVLVAVSGEVNAVIDRYDRHGATPDFVLSPLPRGGFSGGPAIASDFVLGVVCQGLLGDPTEPGLTAAVSVEPLVALMMDNGLRPSGQVELLEILPD